MEPDNVYTMVVPIENIAPYSGDWILWFAERQSRPGETPFVRAPVPLRKFESVQPLLPGTRSELRVQFAAVINKDGKFESLALLRGMNPVLDQLVLGDLAAWEFKPATRDGMPIDVDVVLEIPFVCPPKSQKAPSLNLGSSAAHFCSCPVGERPRPLEPPRPG